MLLCTVTELAALVSRLARLGNARSHSAKQGGWQSNGPAQWVTEVGSLGLQRTVGNLAQTNNSQSLETPE